MKKLSIAFLSIVCLSFQLNAQKTVSLPPIHKIIVSSGILLEINDTTLSQLEINAPGVDSSCIERKVKDGILTLKLVNGFGCKGKVSARLASATIREIEAMGKAEVSTKKLMKCDSLLLTFRSGSQGYIDMDIKYLKVEIAGGGVLKAEGYAIRQDISVVTGTFSGFELEGDQVTVKATIGGKAKVCGGEELKATTASGGYIGFKCSPKKKTFDSEAGGSIEESSE